MSKSSTNAQQVLSKVPSSAGRKRPPGGSRKGCPNKSTADVREAIAKLAAWAGPKMQGWIETVAANDPGRALDILGRLFEYHIPKLGRTEHVGDAENPVTVEVTTTDSDLLLAKLQALRAKADS